MIADQHMDNTLDMHGIAAPCAAIRLLESVVGLTPVFARIPAIFYHLRRTFTHKGPDGSGTDYPFGTLHSWQKETSCQTLIAAPAPDTATHAVIEPVRLGPGFQDPRYS